jgi:hypothetical protein
MPAGLVTHARFAEHDVAIQPADRERPHQPGLDR